MGYFDAVQTGAILGDSTGSLRRKRSFLAKGLNFKAAPSGLLQLRTPVCGVMDGKFFFVGKSFK
jgi:hypothetical protein